MNLLFITIRLLEAGLAAELKDSYKLFLCRVLAVNSSNLELKC